MDAQTSIAIAVLGISVIGSSGAGLVWAIRQEGRINAHDQLFAEREKQADERHAEVLKKLEEIKTVMVQR